MAEEGTRWIVVENWEKFQHYSDRTPPWIKLYTQLVDDQDFMSLTPGERWLVIGTWILYAKSDGKLRMDVKWLTRQLGVRITPRNIERLIQAGLITIVASKPQAISEQRASTTLLREEKRKNATRSSEEETRASASGAGAPRSRREDKAGADQVMRNHGCTKDRDGTWWTPAGREIVGSNIGKPIVEIDGKEYTWKNRRLYDPDEPMYALLGKEEQTARAATMMEA